MQDINTGEEYTIHIFAKAIENGEILKIKILPNSKYGELIEKENSE